MHPASAIQIRVWKPHYRHTTQSTGCLYKGGVGSFGSGTPSPRKKKKDRPLGVGKFKLAQLGPTQTPLRPPLRQYSYPPPPALYKLRQSPKLIRSLRLL